MFLLLLLACAPTSTNEVPTATVDKGDFKVVLSLPGELKAVKSVYISAPSIRGNLKVTTVAEEGKRVSVGDVLVTFDGADLERELETALSRLTVAETKIAQQEAQLEVELGSAQSDVTKAELDLQRAQMRLTTSETVPRVERDGAVLDVQEYTLSVARSKAALQSKALQGKAAIELLVLDANEARAKVAQVRSQLAQMTITAPSEGLVILTEAWRNGKEGKISAGDSVWSGNSLMELPDLSAMEVEAWVHEADAGQVAVGRTATVVIDAQPEPPFTGTLSKVADLAVKRREDSEARHLKVVVSLSGTDPVMKPGMSVRAEILVDSVPDVLSVPREAVFFGDDQSWVWKQGYTGWGKTPVKLGKTNDTDVVVTEGLVEGDVVALVDPEAAAAGKATPAGSREQP